MTKKIRRSRLPGMAGGPQALTLAASVLLLIAAAAAQQVPDTSFRPPIASPAYPEGQGPLVVIDQALTAQTVSTQILGLVTDPTGSVVPGATITAKRTATGDARTTQSNETGNYVFPLLGKGVHSEPRP